MSFVLLRKFFKKNAVLYWSFIAGMVVYLLLLIFLYPVISAIDPDNVPMGGGHMDFGDIGVFTGSMMADITGLIGVILFVMLAFRLAFRPIERGHLSAYLLCGISRKKYIITACSYLLLSLAIVWVILLGLSFSIFAIMGESFVWYNFMAVVSLSVLSLAAITFLSFFLGILLAGKRSAAGLMIAVPIALVLLFTFSFFHSSIEWLRWLSIIGWFLHGDVATGSFGLWWLVALAYVLIVAGGFIASIFIFKKKNLSL